MTNISLNRIVHPDHPPEGVLHPHSIKKKTELDRETGHSSMSVRTLKESLKGDSSSVEAARQRRIYRKASHIANSAIQDSQTLEGELVGKEDLSVSFTSVEIREFPIRMGDNPSVSSGPPLTIGWDHFNAAIIDIDSYESNLPARRKKHEFAIPSRERYIMLLRNTTLTEAEIIDQVKRVKRAKWKRNRTQTKLETAHVEEKFELARRGLRNLFQKDKKRQEKQMINATLESDRKEREKRLNAYI